VGVIGVACGRRGGNGGRFQEPEVISWLIKGLGGDSRKAYSEGGAHVDELGTAGCCAS